MEHGVVRKVLVCFFKEAEHVDQAPVERVAFAVRVDGDAGGSVDSIRLQVCVELAVLVVSRVLPGSWLFFALSCPTPEVCNPDV